MIKTEYEFLCTILMEDRYSRNPFGKRVVRGGLYWRLQGGGGNPRVFKT